MTAAAATVPAAWLRTSRRPRSRRGAWADFEAVLAEETRLGMMAEVYGLHLAAGLLFGCHELLGLGVRPGDVASREAMLELLQRTDGQPFRKDTPSGPLFVWGPLWRFAGRPGRGQHPTWRGEDWRQ